MEITQAFAWIDSTLRADTALMAVSTGGVWQDYADIATLPPFVVFGSQSASDVLTVNKVRLFVDILVQIKAVGPATNYAALITIANRIDALFDVRNVGLPGGGGVLACWREEELAYSEIVNGAAWNNLGGIYHLQLQGS